MNTHPLTKLLATTLVTSFVLTLLHYASLVLNWQKELDIEIFANIHYFTKPQLINILLALGCSENSRVYFTKSLSISQTIGKLPDSTNSSSQTQVRERMLYAKTRPKPNLAFFFGENAKVLSKSPLAGSRIGNRCHSTLCEQINELRRQ